MPLSYRAVRGPTPDDICAMEEKTLHITINRWWGRSLNRRDVPLLISFIISLFVSRLDSSGFDLVSAVRCLFTASSHRTGAITRRRHFPSTFKRKKSIIAPPIIATEPRRITLRPESQTPSHRKHGVERQQAAGPAAAVLWGNPATLVHRYSATHNYLGTS